ncbi:hypothetical protein SAMN05444920_110154 [Nonomuraea solani]|uniref:Uncharacterized protein n=1 Tax=Nonomuraea solani TaxID=1144553 RepID=A0A1H6EJ28_9ACTN|nr:hypothetical protein [Nonomuraea solani]SEG96919.1 hypothetical protein SAMN05444920_110154 [Nonomuraea solani]
MTITTPEAPATAPAPKPRKSRWLRWAALPLIPLLLLYVVAMTPHWLDDYRVSRLMDRILDHPLPPETGFGDFGTQAVVSGDSTDCWVDLRFSLDMKRPTDEILAHYRKADFTKGDDNFSEIDFSAWVWYDDSGKPSAATDKPVVHGSLVIEVSALFPGSTFMDTRCW